MYQNNVYFTLVTVAQELDNNINMIKVPGTDISWTVGRIPQKGNHYVNVHIYSMLAPD